MAQKSLGSHLFKCPEKPHNFKHCFYNYFHVVADTKLDVNIKSILICIVLLNKLFFQEHERNCPNKNLMDDYLFSIKNTVRPNIRVSAEKTILITEELWDKVCI